MKLFDPIQIGHLEIKNRIAFAPTHMGYATPRGEVTDQLLCHYTARARGGVGLVIVEGTGITGKFAFSAGRGLACVGDFYRQGLKELAEVIHFTGVKAVVQIGLGQGAQALFKLREGRDLVAPSPGSTRIDGKNLPRGLKSIGDVQGEPARALTPEEIGGLIDSAVDAARVIQEAGFEGIEIHGAHGYLLAEFVSPLFNRRQDEYGGSFEKRLTLPIRLVERIRQKVGKRFIIGYRMSGSEHVEGGLALGESVQAARILEKGGVDYLHLSSGCYGALNWLFPDQEGAFLPEAKAFKEALRIPVICPNIHDPHTAERALQEGAADMVSLCRALLVDPEWPLKAREGRFNEINRCNFCCTCVMTMLIEKTGVRCSRNPELGWERFLPKYFPQPRRKV